MSEERWVHVWNSRAKSGLEMGDEITGAAQAVRVSKISQGEGTESQEDAWRAANS